MCGRFVGYRNLDELKEIFPIDRSACEVTANYNAAPSQEILEKALLTDLVSYPVSKQVNSTRNNDASCIDPVD
jgi:putative SOS response-associated peptidase YedK